MTKIDFTGINSPNHALCVDLDGTLLRSDLLHESLLALLARNPFYLFLLPFWLLKGKAAFKREIATRVEVTANTLPYDMRILELLRTTSQRPRVLCTASDALLVQPIADHLGLFESVMASDGCSNLAGRRKAEKLVERFGERGFDYVGNSDVDLQVWKHAAAGLVVGSDALAEKAGLLTQVRAHWPATARGGLYRLRTWVKAMRIYQWAKNLLVFVPLLAAHRVLEPEALVQATVAFLAFGLCASGVYLLNDLLDLSSDRQHSRKCKRPFAAGDLPVLQGLFAAVVLTVVSFILAAWCGWKFALVLLGYWLLTVSYSLHLKRLVMIDVILLAALYTVRIIAGAAAIGAPLSFWLLSFSMFIFLSLALLKRYTELHAAQAAGKGGASGRGYDTMDLPLIESLGAAAGYIGVLVLALYINSPESLTLYHQPKLLWLLCPMLLYWVSHMWMVAHRGGMHDDPIVFAASDKASLVVICLCAIAVVLAT